MCGITGIVAPDSVRFASQLERMTSALAHRGPDGQDTHFFDDCGLGHTRLSIIDLSTGAQPMLSAGSTVGITFNGEIYGYKDIRSRLTNFPFRTTSDTEVILALYETHGADFVSKLPGMFAFAIWDDQAHELVAARDRFGEKPFYFAFGSNGEFLFASEIKALIASGMVEPVLDLESLAFYLQHGYVHPHETIFQNIHSLPPAHILCFRDGEVSIRRYWELPDTNSEIGLGEAREEFRRLLTTAVRKQLIADVPVAAFLSGGLDSSTIVALASQQTAHLSTFSFGFEQFVDELPFARQVANRHETNHIELFDRDIDVAEMLFTMQRIYDEPFGDSSNIPTYLISKQAREHVKVVLTGDGGDELFGGYSGWYRPLHHLEHMNLAMSLFYRVLYRVVRLSGPLMRTVFPAIRDPLDAIQIGKRHDSIGRAHYLENLYFSDFEIRRLGLHRLPDHPQVWDRYRSGTVDDAIRMDLEHYMPGDILVKTDRASMAHGLELRAPFLDVDFAEFCISLPSSLKVQSREDKVVLRRAFEAQWPKAIRERGKMGFGGPVHVWLEEPAVSDLKASYLQDPARKLFNLLDYDAVQAYLDRNNVQTWILLNLSVWMETHSFHYPDAVSIPVPEYQVKS